MGHMVLPLIDFNCQNLRKFIYKLSEHATAVMGVGLDPELNKMVRALGSGYRPNRGRI